MQWACLAHCFTTSEEDFLKREMRWIYTAIEDIYGGINGFRQRALYVNVIFLSIHFILRHLQKSNFGFMQTEFHIFTIQDAVHLRSKTQKC